MILNLLYAGLLLVASPLLIYRAVAMGKYRGGWAAKLLGRTGFPPKRGPRVWLHAVSVGEVNLLVGLVPKLEAAHPGLRLVVSTTTVTGYLLARQRFGAERVFYAPLDFSWAVRCALNEVDPDLLILAELELWPNWIKAAHRRHVPIVVINGRLSQQSAAGYRRLGRLMRPTFRRVTAVLCQNETDAKRFRDLGVAHDAVHVTGSLKFDNAPQDRHAPGVKRCRQLAGLRSDHHVWIAGSTQPDDQRHVLEVYQRLRLQFPKLRLILVPRHAEKFAAAADQIAADGLGCRRRSEHADEVPAADLRSDEVYLVDAIGELRDWYGTADIAFVGGSFGHRGGQNMLEPAGYGAAVCFGPNTSNFRDIADQLLSAEAAVRVRHASDLEAFVARCLSDTAYRGELGQAARRVVTSHRGANGRTVAAINALIPSRPVRRAG